MTLSVGNIGYIIEKGYIEECAIQEVHDDYYTVKSSYYTFVVPKKEMFNSYSTAEEALNVLRDKKLNNYLKVMENKDDFIAFCIKKVYHNAHNPEDYDQELIIALKQKYEVFFGKELD